MLRTQRPKLPVGILKKLKRKLEARTRPYAQRRNASEKLTPADSFMHDADEIQQSQVSGGDSMNFDDGKVERQILELQQEYAAYSRIVDLAYAKRDEEQFSTSFEIELACERSTAAANKRLYQIAWDLADMPVMTLKGMQTKAKILQELCEDNRSDIVHTLAISLCLDLQRRDQG